MNSREGLPFYLSVESPAPMPRTATVIPPSSKRAPHVSIENFKPINTGGLLKASFTACIGPWKIHSCRLIQERGKKAWISPPQQEWTGKDGKKRYSALIEMPDRIKQAIEDAAMVEFKKAGR